MIESSSATFEADVIAASRETPVLVDFWAPWCGPCRVLGPVLEKLEAEAKGRWKLVKINTEADPVIAQQFRISSIPAVKLFRDGRVAAEFVGALPESHLRSWLDERIPNASQKALATAKAARAEGRRDAAEQLLEGALTEDPTAEEVRVELAELLFLEDRARALNLIDGLDDSIEFAERVGGMRQLDGLSAKLESGGDGKAWEHYLAGIRALQSGEVEKALESWIDVIKIDRSIDDGGARQACIALFHVLGEQHPVTQEYRPAFASALF